MSPGSRLDLVDRFGQGGRNPSGHSYKTVFVPLLLDLEAVLNFAWTQAEAHHTFR